MHLGTSEDTLPSETNVIYCVFSGSDVRSKWELLWSFLHPTTEHLNRYMETFRRHSVWRWCSLQNTRSRGCGWISIQHTSLSLSASALLSARWRAPALSVKTQICCFSNFTCKYSWNHSTAIVFVLCVAYVILSDDGTIINQDFCAD